MKTKTTQLLKILICAVIAPSLGATPLLHYQLDEGSGTTAFDSGATPSANGTLTGAGSGWVENAPVPGWGDTPPSPVGSGFAYSLNGSTRSFINGGNVPKLQSLGDFTFTLWMNLSAANVNDRIFSTRGSTTGATIGYLDLLTTSTDVENMTLSFQMSNGGTPSNVSSETFDASDWVFVSIVRSAATGQVQYYFGDTNSLSLTDGGTTTGLGTATNMNQNSGDFLIGATAATTNNRSPSGYFSDFRFYDAALSENDVNAVRMAIPEPATIGYLFGIGVFAMVYIRLRRAAGIVRK